MKKPFSAQTTDRRSWSHWRRSNFIFFEERLSALPASSTLIDIGAGPLQFGSIFKRFKYVGVDFVAYPDVSVIADLTKPLPLESDSAEIVVLSNTLEHIPEPSSLLVECFRILKPGGHIVGTIPFLVPVHQAPYDFNRYTNFQLERLLNQAGFSGVGVAPLGKLIDTYDTLELKFFAQLPGRYLKLPFRFWRRFEMRMLRLIFGHISSTNKSTEGYGFWGRKTDKSNHHE